MANPKIWTQLRAALAGFDAQYGERGIAEQLPDVPRGHVERVEAVVRAARAVLAADPNQYSIWRSSPASIWAYAYNAAVNYGSGRAHKKMWDLIRALNDNMRQEGKAKMDELVELGIIDSYTECPSECCMRPGGLFHAKDCPNEYNTEFRRQIRERVREQLPEPQTHYFSGISLVGEARDHRLDMILPLVQQHNHRDPIGNPITCQEAGCDA